MQSHIWIASVGCDIPPPIMLLLKLSLLLFIPILGRRASILSLSWTWLNRLESKMDVDYSLDMNNDFLTIHTSCDCSCCCDCDCGCGLSDELILFCSGNSRRSPDTSEGKLLFMSNKHTSRATL